MPHVARVHWEGHRSIFKWINLQGYTTRCWVRTFYLCSKCLRDIASVALLVARWSAAFRSIGDALWRSVIGLVLHYHKGRRPVTSFARATRTRVFVTWLCRRKVMIRTAEKKRDHMKEVTLKDVSEVLYATYDLLRISYMILSKLWVAVSVTHNLLMIM